MIGAISDHYVASSGGGGGYAAEVLADSPLAYWRLGDASGTTMTDSSGNSRNGTYVNSPTLGATGLLTTDADTCVDWDGSNDHATVTSAAWMNGWTAFTAEAIVKPDTVSGDRIIVCRTSWLGGPTDGGRGWHLIIQGGQFNLGIRFTDGTAIDSKVGPTVTAGTTYHAAMVFSPTTLKLYLNGTEVYTTTAHAGKTVNSPVTDLRLSREAYGVGFFDGKMDEVAVYGTALSAARVAAHYAAI